MTAGRESLLSAPIEELLIAVATPDAREDSPERKVAWDEIKRRVRDPGVLEIKELMVDLQLEASNYGVTTPVGKLCIRAHDVLYWLARSVLEEDR